MMSNQPVDPQWYRKIWTLDVQELSWTEYTASEVDFVVEALGLQGDDSFALLVYSQREI